MFTNIPSRLSSKINSKNYNLVSTSRDVVTGSLVYNIVFTISSLFSRQSKSEFTLSLRENSPYVEITLHKRISKRRLELITDSLSDVMHKEKEHKFIVVKGNYFTKEIIINNSPYIKKETIEAVEVINKFRIFKELVNINIVFSNTTGLFTVLIDGNVCLVLSSEKDFRKLYNQLLKASSKLCTLLESVNISNSNYSNKVFSFVDNGTTYYPKIIFKGGKLRVKVYSNSNNSTENQVKCNK